MLIEQSKKLSLLKSSTHNRASSASAVGAGVAEMMGGDASPFVSPDPKGSCEAALVRRIGASVAQAYRGSFPVSMWLLVEPS